MLYLGVITQPAALCLLPFHRTSPVGPQHFPLGLPVYRPLLPDVPWLPTLSTGMKSLKATLFPSLPSPSLISFWRSPSWWWCLGEGTLSLLHMEDREQSCWGLMACPSSFPLLPLRGEQKTGFKYLKSEFGPKNLIIFWRATAANGHSKGNGMPLSQGYGSESSDEKPHRWKEICLLFHIAFTEIITAAY